MNYTEILITAVTAMIGGGLTSFLLFPEKKVGAKLDNADRVVAKYESILVKYEHRITELEAQVRDLEKKNAEKDKQIEALQKQLNALQAKAVTRGAGGRFAKKTKE